MEHPEHQQDQSQDQSPEHTIRDIAERAANQAADDASTRRRQRNRMLQHYIELISEYQDSRRSEDAREPSPDDHASPQDDPHMPPPPELVQSIRDAGGDLPACEAVLLDNLRQMHQITGRDVILYAAAFRQGERGPSPDAVINEDDISTFADIITSLNRQDEFPDPQPGFHHLPHGAHTGQLSGPEQLVPHRFMQARAGRELPQLDLILHSPGGTLPATQAIVRALRGRYDHIRVFVPQRAMSAATMLACAANQIIMAGFASLSPTDPMVIVPTIGGSMLLPAQAVVDERDELLYRLERPEASGNDLVSLVSQPPGMFHDARRIIVDSRMTLGGWIENYSRNPNAPRGTTGQRIAERLSNYYSHFGPRQRAHPGRSQALWPQRGPHEQLPRPPHALHDGFPRRASGLHAYRHRQGRPEPC